MHIEIDTTTTSNTPSLEVKVEGHPVKKGMTIVSPSLDARIGILSEYLKEVLQDQD